MCIIYTDKSRCQIICEKAQFLFAVLCLSLKTSKQIKRLFHANQSLIMINIGEVYSWLSLKIHKIWGKGKRLK